MKSWTNLSWDEIHNLPLDEFDKLAKLQTTLFPDLLKITDEEDVQDTFYRAYKRERERERERPCKAALHKGNV